jgi:hypothetical protein
MPRNIFVELLAVDADLSAKVSDGTVETAQKPKVLRKIFHEDSQI